MVSSRRCRFAVTYGLTLAAAFLALGVAPSVGGHHVTAEDAPTCRWQPLPIQLPASYYAAAVFDPTDNALYYYGGLTVNGEPSSSLYRIDLDDPDIERATLREAAFVGQRPDALWGHAGIFHPSADGDPEILWIAGQRGDRFDPTATPVTPRPTRRPTERPT